MFVGGVHKKTPKHKAESLYGKSGEIRGARMRKKLADDLLSCRYELKYRISESKATAVTEFIKPYLHLDRYSKLQPKGTYPIVSLYLDSGNLHLCRESLSGKKNRFKLRIRSYSDDLDKPRFFEIKRRMNNVIIKSRVRVMDHNVASVLAGQFVPEQKFKTDEDALRQFMLYVNSINAVPVVLIRYMRQAFESDSDNRVRVTFDRRLCYNVTTEPKVRLNCSGWQHHPIDAVILEIKFTNRYPAWLSRMVKCFNLDQQSTSKYATSVKHSCSLGFCAPKIMV